MRHRVQTRFSTRSMQQYWPAWRRHVGLNATRLQKYDALRIEWKAVHQACRQWSMADGNDSSPMEVDALMKGKGKGKTKSKGKGKENGREKGRAKSKDKPKEGTPDTPSMKCFFCKEKGHVPNSRLGLLRRRQWVTSRARKPSRKTDGSLPWTTSMRSCVS